MPVEDDSFDSDLLLRKPSLQARLQTNMNLHMCFVNEAAATEANVARDLDCVPSSTPDVVPVQSQVVEEASFADILWLLLSMFQFCIVFNFALF